jgi:hypothetical protein
MKKKEEFPGAMRTCCQGTPFPRSALFLEISMWKNCKRNKSTKGMHPKVIKLLTTQSIKTGKLEARGREYAHGPEAGKQDGRGGCGRRNKCDPARGKKRSSQAPWEACCQGTPFPRSALFL